jgi:hypothetical protein
MGGIDEWRVAKLVLETYGFDATDYCSLRLRELSAAGDFDGCAKWSRILALVNQMLDQMRQS